MKFTVGNEKDLGEKVYGAIKSRLREGVVIGLEGELGTGKTTLVRHLSKFMGVKDRVASPTFNLRKNYALAKPFRGISGIQHIDLYRFDQPRRQDYLEVEEWLGAPDKLTFIEWPDKIPGLVDKLDMIIKIKDLDNGRREVEIR